MKEREKYRRHFGVEPPDDLGKYDVWLGYPSPFIRRHPHADVGDDEGLITYQHYDHMLEQITLLALGWLGGVLSPAIVEAIKSRREAEAVLGAIKAELNEVAYRLVLAGYKVETHLGTTDRTYLKWVQDSMVLYHGKEPTERIADYISAQLSWTDDVLEAHVAKEAAQGTKALVLPKFALSFADARLPSWHAIPAVVRLDLLAIQTDVSLLNDAVDQSRASFSLTFTKLEGSNHQTVVENIRGAYAEYGKRCRIAADRIHSLQGML